MKKSLLNIRYPKDLKEVISLFNIDLQNFEELTKQLSLCKEHEEIFKYYCFDCNEYYCSFCIKKHNTSHYCFSTLKISKSDFNELSSLIQLLKEENDHLNESKIDEVINDLRGKKEKDLLMIYKFEESIKHKYDTIINIYEKIKNQLNELKNKINKSFESFKSNLEKKNFEPDSLYQAIEESFNKANKINFEFFPFFKNYQEPQKSFLCKLFNFKKGI